MDTILELFDTSAKRWLAVLAAAVLVSVVSLERAFMNAVTPQENTVTVQSSTSGQTEQVQAKSEPSWGNQAQAQAQVPEESPVVNRVSPFDNKPTFANKNDPMAHQRMVHQQAEYLRGLIAAGKLPKGFGNLTKERVDEMEKKGISID